MQVAASEFGATLLSGKLRQRASSDLVLMATAYCRLSSPNAVICRLAWAASALILRTRKSFRQQSKILRYWKAQMAQAESALTKRDMETALIEKCWKDPNFMQDVVSDPKGTIEKALGQKLPEQLKIFVHPENAQTLHFSIPPTPASVAELSDEDLEKVAGGTEIVVATIAATLAVGTAAVTVASAAGVTMRQGW